MARDRGPEIEGPRLEDRGAEARGSRDRGLKIEGSRLEDRGVEARGSRDRGSRVDLGSAGGPVRVCVRVRVR
eukprot:2965054-Pyramimonas_sp.AAC.1